VWRERGGLLDSPDFERLLILQQPVQLPKSAVNAIRLMALGFEWRRKIQQLIPEQRTFQQTTSSDRFRPKVSVFASKTLA
jgi:hypothetical protein